MAAHRRMLADDDEAMPTADDDAPMPSAEEGGACSVELSQAICSGISEAFCDASTVASTSTAIPRSLDLV